MAIKINGDNSTSAVGLSSGDDDSGVKPGTNQVEIVTGGTARVTVDNTNTTVANTLAAGESQFTVNNDTANQKIIGADANAADGTAVGGLRYNASGQLVVYAGSPISGNEKFTVTKDGAAEFNGRITAKRDTDTNAGLVVQNSTGTNKHIFYGNGQASFGGGETAIGASGELNTNQNLVLNNGGKGIKFPASNTGNADANTLDDYEEGTWTPRLNGWSGSSYVNVTNSLGASYEKGRYLKIGRTVTLFIEYHWTSMPIANGNPWYIYDFPFPINNVSASAGSIGRLEGVTDPWNVAIWDQSNSTTVFYIHRHPSSGGITGAFGNSGKLIATITYTTTA